MPRPLADGAQTEWTPWNILWAVLAIGLMATGAVWLFRATAASNQFVKDAYRTGGLALAALDHPEQPVAWPASLSAFGPVHAQVVDGYPEVVMGPMDSEHCGAIFHLFTTEPYRDHVQLWLNDATADTWDIRYREAMDYYANQGPYGSYEPSPCEVVHDDQRVLRLVRTS